MKNGNIILTVLLLMPLTSFASGSVDNFIGSGYCDKASCKLKIPIAARIEGTWGPIFQDNDSWIQLQKTGHAKVFGFFNGNTYSEMTLHFRELRLEADQKTIDKIREIQNKGYSLIISRLKAKDPENWHRSAPSQAALESAKRAFIEKYRFIHQCKPVSDDEHEEFESAKPTSKKIQPKDISVNRRSYINNAGLSLIGLRMNSSVCKAEPYGFEEYNKEHWYFYDPEKQARLITAVRPQNDKLLRGPIDAGDFDGDGKSEWIFRDLSEGGPNEVELLKIFPVL